MIKRTLILTTLLSISLLSSFTVPAQAQQRSSWQPFFQRIVSRSPLPRKRGGGRTGLGWEVISPGIWTKQLWTVQPIFIWQVSPNAKFLPDRIEILQMGAKSPLWSQPIQRNSNGSIPIPAKLEPGRTYFVRFLSRNPDLQRYEVTIAWEFQVMSIAQRQRVTEALDRIDKNLNPSEQLQQRIEVFAKFELWSDAFQEIDRSSLSVTERQTIINQLLSQLKGSESNRGRSR